MSFFSGTDYTNNHNLPKNAIQIPRPSELKDSSKTKKLNNKNNLLNFTGNQSSCSSDYQNKQISSYNGKQLSMFKIN